MNQQPSDNKALALPLNQRAIDGVLYPTFRLSYEILFRLLFPGPIFFSGNHTSASLVLYDKLKG